MLLRAQKEIQESQGELMELITHQELVAIQLTWFRDSVFTPKVADIYNRIYDIRITMPKHAERIQREEELLREACADNPEHVELIHEMLTLQKNKALLLRKRGLQQDLEARLERFIARRIATAVHV